MGERGQRSKGLPIAPPVLEYLAGLTRKMRPDVEIVLIDANKEDFRPDEIGADLYGFTILTPQAPWVYRTSDALRADGKKVVLGGIHVTALPAEAGAHADAVVLGEADSVWAELIDDAEKGILKPVYTGKFTDLVELPQPGTDLWGTKYVYGYFQTFRGCIYNCKFCSVHKFFGGKLRHRPVGEVVEEVARSRYRLFMGIDDNIWGHNIDRSIELYREMRRNVRGKSRFGQGHLASMYHPRSDELLDSARRSGLTAVLVGWESNNPASLESYRAVTKQGRNRRDAIKKIRDHGIEVMLFIMVGGREDTREDFDGILSICDELKVAAHPVMTTPFPGTDLYEEYEPFLIPGLDWDIYDGNHAVFHHDSLSTEEREDAIIKLRADLYTLPRILGRIRQISLRGFPMSHITSWMVQFPQGRAFKEYMRARKAQEYKND